LNKDIQDIQDIQDIKINRVEQLEEKIVELEKRISYLENLEKSN
jgi:polyhydroxyalkanoate synthesis regulator phasin